MIRDLIRLRGSLFAIALLAMACTITTRPVNIGTKTALEHQLMGELEPLTDEELLAASVRTPPSGPAATDGLDSKQATAMAARRRQVFNRDDIDELRAKGCVGEAKNATIAVRDCDTQGDQSLPARRDRLVSEENADRQAILDWVASSDESFSGAGRAQLVDMYHRLLLDRVKPGEWIEGANGWAKK
jgi:uncharacterized protein YdbL (DUF1318 family)